MCRHSRCASGDSCTPIRAWPGTWPTWRREHACPAWPRRNGGSHRCVPQSHRARGNERLQGPAHWLQSICPSYPCPPLLLDVPWLRTRLLRLASCLNITMKWLIGSLPLNLFCTVMPKSTGNPKTSFQVVILKIFWYVLCYPDLSWIYLGIN